jgi:fluoride exporter
MLGMERLLWVCLGGAAGSGARYLVTGWVSERLGSGFPWGTLCVNVIGSFLLGAIMQLASTASSFSPTTQVTLTIGVLGGFTTYSTFNYETLASFQQGAWTLAAANLVATVVGCLAAGFLGQAAVRALIG